MAKMSKREIARRKRMRQSSYGKMALAVCDYLKSNGWNILLSATPSVESVMFGNQMGAFKSHRFVLDFMGIAPKDSKLSTIKEEAKA